MQDILTTINNDESNTLTAFENALSEDSDFDVRDFASVKLNWDKDYVQEVTSTDVLPSYDTTLYYKVEVPDTQAYVYVTTELKDDVWTSYTYDDDFYDSGYTLPFSDFASSYTITDKVNGEIVTTDTITLENKQIYSIVIACIPAE